MVSMCEKAFLDFLRSVFLNPIKSALKQSVQERFLFNPAISLMQSQFKNLAN